MQQLSELVEILRRHRFRAPSEADLQRSIEQVLNAAAISFTREEWLSARDRVDFLVCEGIAMEVKVDGSAPSVARQLHRYAKHPRVSGLLLVTTCVRHTRMPSSLQGKPVATLYLGRL